MNKLFLLLVCIMLTSCVSIFPKKALKKTGVLDAKTELKIINNQKQNIIFIPMHHVGRLEFYDDVANKIDSLQNQGYTVFYESVADENQIDSLVMLTSVKKLRKIMRFFPQEHKGYIDTTTNVIAGKLKYRGKHKLINQPAYAELNVDQSTALKADIGLTELINAFEKHNGTIKLDSCDLTTSLTGERYKCKKVKKRLMKIFEREYIIDYRNKFLAESIINSKKNKVLVVYGDAHFYGLYFQLFSLDKSYRIRKK